MSKLNKALEIFKKNPNLSRKDFIAKLVSELGMKEATASVYHHKIKKGEVTNTKEDDSVVAAKVPTEKPSRKVAIQKDYGGIVSVKPEVPVITENKYTVKVPDCVPAFLQK